jgi:hypothetical protein
MKDERDAIIKRLVGALQELLSCKCEGLACLQEVDQAPPIGVCLAIIRTLPIYGPCRHWAAAESALAAANMKEQPDGGVALYHRVFCEETFEDAAQTIFRLVKAAAARFPNASRFLYLDIDDHRNPEGGYDKDMFELQKEFLVRYMMPFLSGAFFPLADAPGGIRNTKGQREDLPKQLTIYKDDIVIG